MDSAIPAYQKVMKRVKQEIVSGQIGPNQKIDSIKELAKRYQVNQNTVQRALANLESEGLLCSRRTAGKYVTDNELLIKSIRNKEAREAAEKFVSDLQELGIQPDELVKLFTGPEIAEAIGLE